MPETPHVTLADGRVIHSDSEILGGTPVFVGTRVPVQTLIDYLEGGHTVDEFLDNFPSVRREQVHAFFEQATRALLAGNSKLTPFGRPHEPRQPGGWEGQVKISEDFDDPLSSEVQDAFEGHR
jgi:uncharacterized protein (DUF433 family)